MNLPQVLPNETINDYIKRLINNQTINATQIRLAISKYNSK